MTGRRTRREALLAASLAVVGLATAVADFRVTGEAPSAARELASTFLSPFDPPPFESTPMDGRSNLPLLHLTLSRSDTAHFERIYSRFEMGDREAYREGNRWRRARLRFGETLYDVRVKSHGREPDRHTVTPSEGNRRYISLTVRMAPGDRVAGLHQFKLIVRENLSENQQLVMEMARRAAVLVQDHRLVRVQINKWPEKLYYFSNELTNEYTDATGLASMRAVSFDYSGGLTDKSMMHADASSYRRVPSDYAERFERALTQSGVADEEREPLFRRYSQMNAAIARDEAADPAAFFDVEYLTRFEVVRYVLGLRGHGFNQGNLRVLLNTANGRFYPAFNRDNEPARLDLSDGRTPARWLNTWRKRDNAPIGLPMFDFIATSEHIRQAIYRAVYAFLTEHGERVAHQLGAGFVETPSLAPTRVAVVRPGASFAADDTAIKGLPVGYGQFSEILDTNMRSLRQYLNRSAPEYSVSRAPDELVLAIQPNSMSALRIGRLRIGVAGGRDARPAPVTVQVADRVNALTDREAEPFEVTWRPDGTLDLSPAVAGARFATGVDTSAGPALPLVMVRWVADMDAAHRRGLELEFGLEPVTEIEDTTGRYTLADVSPENIEAIVRHPEVEDTHLIDRGTMTVPEIPYPAARLKPMPRIYRLVLRFEGVATERLRSDAVDLAFVSTVTGREIEGRRVDTPRTGAEARAVQDPSRLVRDWIAAHPLLRVTETEPGRLTLARDTYRIEEHLILPDGYDLRIEAGTEFQLGEGVVILVHGGLQVDGVDGDPVTIRPIDPARPFGSVAAVGDGTQRTQVSHLDLSGGDGTWFQGIRFAGGLSIHYQRHVSVDHAFIHDNHGADGLSIKYASGLITDSVFTGNHDDQVDLEYVVGIVRNSRFEGASGGDPNGDGLDLRASSVVVVDNEIRGHPDKGMSVGEESQALFVANQLVDNQTAIAVKDQSTAYLHDNRFDRNDRDVRAYLKQRFFGGGRVVVARDASPGSGPAVRGDSRSAVSRVPGAAIAQLRPTSMELAQVPETFTTLSRLWETP